MLAKAPVKAKVNDVVADAGGVGVQAGTNVMVVKAARTAVVTEALVTVATAIALEGVVGLRALADTMGTWHVCMDGTVGMGLRAFTHVELVETCTFTGSTVLERLGGGTMLQRAELPSLA